MPRTRSQSAQQVQQEPCSSSNTNQAEPDGRAIGYFYKKGSPGSPTKSRRERDVVGAEIDNYEITWPLTHSRKAFELPSGQPLSWWFNHHRVLPAELELGCLLPSMRLLAHRGGGDASPCFKLFNPSLTIFQNAISLLKELRQVLFPSAFYPYTAAVGPGMGLNPVMERQVGAEGSRCWPWFSPLVVDKAKERQKEEEERWKKEQEKRRKVQLPQPRPMGPQLEPKCMVASSAAVRMVEGMHKVSGGYVEVQLGSLKRVDASGVVTWTPVFELGHRLVYWAMQGPVDQDARWWAGQLPCEQAGPVVMHSCHNKSCLQPWHLLLGNYSENNKRKQAADYNAAWERQSKRASEQQAQQHA